MRISDLAAIPAPSI